MLNLFCLWSLLWCAQYTVQGCFWHMSRPALPGWGRRPWRHDRTSRTRGCRAAPASGRQSRWGRCCCGWSERWAALCARIWKRRSCCCWTGRIGRRGGWGPAELLWAAPRGRSRPSRSSCGSRPPATAAWAGWSACPARTSRCKSARTSRPTSPSHPDPPCRLWGWGSLTVCFFFLNDSFQIKIKATTTTTIPMYHSLQPRLAVVVVSLQLFPRPHPWWNFMQRSDWLRAQHVLGSAAALHVIHTSPKPLRWTFKDFKSILIWLCICSLPPLLCCSTVCMGRESNS